ncbi:MAG: PQQ-binding-like beta-propeller repeat protein, partial [Planctomycetota bacterium]
TTYPIALFSKVMVYAQSSRGLLHAFDGETGEQRWKFPTGNPRYPNVPVAANDKFVAAANGSTLYVVDLNDGKLLFHRQLKSAPAAGLAITQEHIYVPVTGDIVEAFRLNEKERRRPPIRFSSAGDTRFRPVATPSTVSWPTGRGFLYVVDAEELKVKFRVEARSPIVEHAAYLAPDRLYATSRGGYLFCVVEKTGRMLWQFSAGEPIARAPVAIGKRVYIVTDSGVLMAVNAKTGLQDWQTRGISRVLTVSNDRLVCKGTRSNIVTVDLSSGSRMDSVSVSNADKYIANPYSDRLYVTTKTGRLICLKPQGAGWPTIHVIPMTKEEIQAEKEAAKKGKKEKKKKKPEPKSDSADSSTSDDIFGDDSGDTGESSDDIFGDDADADAGAGADEEDIFGDDAGGADDGSGDDIFGDDSGGDGSDDIFGGDEDDIFGDEGF